jgi:hypothetical protein
MSEESFPISLIIQFVSVDQEQLDVLVQEEIEFCSDQKDV